MYGLGQLGQVGERFMLYAEKGRRVMCPAGTTQESSGRMGTGQQYVQCYRPPVFAAPPVTTTTISPVIETRVPTAVVTQVSPQISPTMAQQQASPGAGVTAAPVAAPGPVSAAPSAGISPYELHTILRGIRETREADLREADRRRAEDEARRTAEARQRAEELETYRATLRDDSAARLAAEVTAVPAIAAPVPVAPSAGAAPMFFGAPAPMDIAAPVAPEARDVIAEAPEAETPWALILLAAAGVGAVVLMGGKGKRKSRAKK